MTDDGAPAISRAELERDLYLRLLELGHSHELEPLLREALRLAIEVTNAAGGHLHMFGPSGEHPHWSLALGWSNEDGTEVQRMASRGIEAEVIATGRVVQTPCAMLDPRFAERPSVRSQRLEAVLCAPIGAPPEGVLYLHGISGAGPFLEADLRLVETFCRHLGPTVRSLTALRQVSRKDPTRPFRERLRVEGIVGSSESIAQILKEIEVAASADIPVLLTGDTGTGKTAIAHAIHENSKRASSKIVEINCAALQGTLFEAEFFGAARGAYTDAREDRPGLVSAADGGTLFLDEIGELHPSNQAKLLQFLQSGTYYRVGDQKSRRANVRLIAATNRNLSEAVEEGTFRRDLYYRLNVFTMRVPSLSERREDIVPLARHFVELASRKHERPLLPLSPGAQVALATMSWPGNIRDIANALELAVVIAGAEHAEQIEAKHLTRASEPAPDKPLTYQQAMHRSQREVIAAALESTKWNVLAASRELDITRAHMYNLIKLHGLQRK